jgi:SAM-dependent methyltransferase/SepF-like predicted cell division protein (DUF552 family)
MAGCGVPQWAADLVGLKPEDEALPAAFPGVNVALNRARLAQFLTEFADDSDVRDLLLLDLLGVSADAPVSSTGIVEEFPALILRPFRIWEYTWLYKALNLARGGLDILELGGPASHLVILAALAGNRVVSVDINPEIVEAARNCASILHLSSLDARVADMRELSKFRSRSFDVILSCSVLEHLKAADQELALRRMSELLRPGGRIGLTFDYGAPAPGANEYLPPPHEPPRNAAEAVRRYARAGLSVVGNAMTDEPIADSLFHSEVVHYAMAALFLGKPPLKDIRRPRPSAGRRSPLSALRAPSLLERVNVHSRTLADRGYRAAETVLGLQQTVESLQDAAAERLREMERIDAPLAGLTTELDHRDAELNRAAVEMQSLRETAAERLREMERKDAALAGLKKELDRRDAELNRAAAEMQSLRETAAERLRDMERKDAALAGLKKELDHRDAELNRSAAEMQSLRETAAERLREMERKDAALAELKTELDRWDAESNRAVAEMQSLRETAAERLREMESKDAALAELKTELDSRDAESNRAAAEMQSLRETAAERLREMESKDAALAGLKTELDSRDAGLNRAAAEMQSLRETAAERLREMERKETCIRDLESQAAKRSEALTRVQAELDLARVDVAQLRSDVAELESVIRRLTHERDELGARAATLEKESPGAYLRRWWKR